MIVGMCSLFYLFLVGVVKWWKRDIVGYSVPFHPRVGDQPAHGCWQHIVRAWKLAVLEKAERELADEANRRDDYDGDYWSSDGDDGEFDAEN